MKRIFITTLLIVALGSMSESFAQIQLPPTNNYGSVYDHDPHLHKYPNNQEPTNTFDDYLNNNQQRNGNNKNGTASHSGSSHNARSSNNNQNNQNNNPHTGKSNRSNQNSYHR